MESPRKTLARIRWWPALLIVLGAAVCLLVVWFYGDVIRQRRVMRTIPVVTISSALLFIWVVFLSRLPRKIRWGLGLALILVGVGARFSLRVQGVTGDLVPILSWRWSSSEAGLGGESARGGAGARAAGAADYPQFLGPDRNATLPGPALARDWDAQPPREVWRRPLGAGWSGFAVAGGLAITQEQRGEEELVTAYDLSTGELVWSHADAARYDTTIGGIGPRGTPTVVDDAVYTVGATGVLNALSLADGTLRWQRQIVTENDAVVPDWGFSGSPLWLDGRVIVNAGGPADASLIAYDAATGEIVWTAGKDAASYASPMLARLAGRSQLILFNKASVAGHDPESGELLWTFPWEARQPNVAQPLPLSGDRLLLSAGYGMGSKVIRLTDQGGKLVPSLVWESPRLKAKFTNIVLHEGRVYGLDDGVLVCLDPETGERCWKRGRYGHGQIILVDDLLLLSAEGGDVVLIDPDPEELRELTRFSALDGKTWNTPALAGRFLLVRNDREAACFELPVDG